MKELLFLYFNGLSSEKGEDIFEYGFSSFSEIQYANYLLEKRIISQDIYDEIMEDDEELFQIIQRVDEDNYEKCLKVFSEYLVDNFTVEEISDVLVRAAE